MNKLDMPNFIIIFMFLALSLSMLLATTEIFIEYLELFSFIYKLCFIIELLYFSICVGYLIIKFLKVFTYKESNDREKEYVLWTSFYLVVGMMISLLLLSVYFKGEELYSNQNNLFLCYTNHSYKLVGDISYFYNDTCKILIRVNKDFINSTAARELFPLVYKSYGD